MVHLSLYTVTLGVHGLGWLPQYYLDNVK